MIKKIFKMIILCMKKYQDPYYQGVASQLAFYFMLSIVPTLLVLSQFLGILDISLEFINKMITKYVQSDMAGTFSHILNYRPVASTNIVLVLMAIWAASKVQFSLARITDYTYTDGEQLGSFLKDRIRAVIILLITIICIALMIVAFIYGEFAVKTVAGGFIGNGVAENLIRWFRWPVAGFLYFMVMAVVYYVLPSERKPFRDIIPGSLFASVGMLAVTICYAIYASRAVTYDLIYGSLASIVALMLWFYFISTVLCLGLLVNKVYWDNRKTHME